MTLKNWRYFWKICIFHFFPGACSWVSRRFCGQFPCGNVSIWIFLIKSADTFRFQHNLCIFMCFLAYFYFIFLVLVLVLFLCCWCCLKLFLCALWLAAGAFFGWKMTLTFFVCPPACRRRLFLLKNDISEKMIFLKMRKNMFFVKNRQKHYFWALRPPPRA